MTDYQKCVNEFMTVSGQDVNSEFYLFQLEDSTIKFRFSLIEEEFNELTKAHSENDTVEFADALADLLYVIYGTASSFGVTLPNNPLYNSNSDNFERYINEFTTSFLKLKNYYNLQLDEKRVITCLQNMVETILLISYDFKLDINFIFLEVHKSNMSKFCKTLKEAKDSVKEYNDKEGDDFSYYKKVGKYYVILRTSDNKVLKGLNYFKPYIIIEDIDI